MTLDLIPYNSDRHAAGTRAHSGVASMLIDGFSVNVARIAVFELRRGYKGNVPSEVRFRWTLSYV